MRIAIFTDTYKPQVNGVVSSIENLYSELRKKHEVVIVAPASNASWKSLKMERDNETKVIRLPSLAFKPYPSYRIALPPFYRFLESIGKIKFDLVHAHTPAVVGLIGLAFASRFKLPLVATYHTLVTELFPHLTKGKGRSSMNFVGNLVERTYIKWFYSSAAIVTSPSLTIKKFLERIGVRSLIRVIPNGIDTNRFSLVKKEEAREKLSLSEDEITFLYLGRLSFEKRIDILLKAFKIVEKEIKEARLLIGGGGPEEIRLKSLARELDLKNARFLGYVSFKTLPELYAACDCFVSASPVENCSMAFLEAMASGLPLIGVNEMGAREIILTNKAGLLAKPNNPQDLAEKMIEIATDEKLRLKIGKRNRIIAKRKYDKKVVSKEFEKLYQELLDNIFKSSIHIT